MITAPTTTPAEVCLAEELPPEAMHGRTAREPWLIVCGGFHEHGGMDRANLALAKHLVASGRKVFLVGHDFEAGESRGMTKIPVPRVLGSTALGERALWRVGQKQAKRILERYPATRLVANGGNFECGDISWVHFVHAAYPNFSEDAPFWIRLKDKLLRQQYRRREAIVLRSARLVIANSESCKRQIVDKVGISSHKVRLVRLGCSPDSLPPTSAERSVAREWLQIRPEQSVVAFVGALTWDERKGMDSLWRAWQQINLQLAGQCVLVVAGTGAKLNYWRRQIQASSLSESVRVLGFTRRVNEVLAAADVLASPCRYETFGLNVQEAICRGVPAIVSASAGIAELYPEEMKPLLLQNPEDCDALAGLICGTLRSLPLWTARTRSFADQLRTHTWDDMARQIVSLATEGAS